MIKIIFILAVLIYSFTEASLSKDKMTAENSTGSFTLKKDINLPDWFSKKKTGSVVQAGKTYSTLYYCGLAYHNFTEDSRDPLVIKAGTKLKVIGGTQNEWILKHEKSETTFDLTCWFQRTAWDFNEQRPATLETLEDTLNDYFTFDLKIKKAKILD